jgi:hypothetical protein
VEIVAKRVKKSEVSLRVQAPFLYLIQSLLLRSHACTLGHWWVTDFSVLQADASQQGRLCINALNGRVDLRLE